MILPRRVLIYYSFNKSRHLTCQTHGVAYGSTTVAFLGEEGLGFMHRANLRQRK